MSEQQDYTNIIQLLDQLIRDFENSLDEQSLLGVEPWSSHLDQLQGLLEMMNDPIISGEFNNNQLSRLHPIDKFDVGDKVIALYNRGEGCASISRDLEVTMGLEIKPHQVQYWLDQYKTRPLMEQTQVSRHDPLDALNEFDFYRDRLANAILEVEAMGLNDFRRSDKHTVYKDLISEMRQMIKDMVELKRVVYSNEELESFFHVVFETLMSYCPQARAEFMAKIQPHRAVYTLLGN